MDTWLRAVALVLELTVEVTVTLTLALIVWRARGDGGHGRHAPTGRSLLTAPRPNFMQCNCCACPALVTVFAACSAAVGCLRFVEHICVPTDLSSLTFSPRSQSVSCLFFLLSLGFGRFSPCLPGLYSAPSTRSSSSRLDHYPLRLALLDFIHAHYSITPSSCR